MVVQLRRTWWWEDASLVDAVARYLETEEEYDERDIAYFRSKPWKYDQEHDRYLGWLNDLPY